MSVEKMNKGSLEKNSQTNEGEKVFEKNYEGAMNVFGVQCIPEKTEKGYKLFLKTTEDAETLIKEFWTQASPSGSRDFDEGQLRPGDDITLFGDRTKIRTSDEFPSPNEEFPVVVLISGNRRPLSEESSQILNEAGLS